MSRYFVAATSFQKIFDFLTKFLLPVQSAWGPCLVQILLRSLDPIELTTEGELFYKMLK